MRLRKSIKVGKNVRVNIGKKGFSSISVGKRGATINAGKKGLKATVGIPGSGLSKSGYIFKSKSKNQSKENLANPKSLKRSNADFSSFDRALEADSKNGLQSFQGPSPTVKFFVGVGVFIMPYIFVWFTFQKGYSNLSRILGLSWFSLLCYVILFS